MEQSQGSTPRQAIAAAERNRASEEQAQTAEFLDALRMSLSGVDQQIAELEETREVAIGAYNEALGALGLRRQSMYAALEAVGEFSPAAPAFDSSAPVAAKRTWGTG